MRVLVTGASGFIGTVLARSLSAQGHSVVALSRRHRNVRADGETVCADIRDAGAVRLSVRDVDAVCHLAALAETRSRDVTAGEHASVNVGGTLTLLKALAEQRSVSRSPVAVIYASSACVYGPAGPPRLAETALTMPTAMYGVSKLAAENAVRRYSLAGLVAGVSLRLFNVAGAQDGCGDSNTDRIVPKALEVAAGRLDALPMHGNGLVVRDFVHVADVADAFVKALAAARANEFQVFNVGACPVSISEVILTAEKVTGRPVPTRTSSSGVAVVERMCADTRLIRNRLGWLPERSSIERIVADAWTALQVSAAQVVSEER